MDAKILLVDNCIGWYCYPNLATRFPLYNASGVPIPEEYVELMKGEDWPETVDWLESCEGIHVKINNSLGNEEFWRVESIDGDVWAINPNADWSEDLDDYFIP